jgi:hypothetical protein
MARTKKEEAEMEINVTPSQKKESFAVRWFKDYAVNNASDLKIVCDLTARSVLEQFMMDVGSNNTEVYAVIFYATFMSILEFIKEKQKRYNNFSIVIANSVNIGYTNNDNEDNEKVGNFMPLMEYVGINRNIILNDDRVSQLNNANSEIFLRWMNLNIKQNGEYYKEIQEKAYEKLQSDFKIFIRTSEAVIPIFCVFFDNITKLLKVKFQERMDTDESEVSMNILGLFDIFYSFNDEEDQEIIEISPNIMVKLSLKSDTIANRE